MPFQKATKRQAKLRMALIGPSGSGKTYTALNIATHLSEKVALIDTERGSASKYAGRFSFDVLELESFHPTKYVEAIHEAEAAGYEVLIIDSLSHAWTGKDGALELVDRAAKRTQSGNSFGAWREVTPLHNQLVDAMVGSRLHILATLRAKTDYAQERDEKTGKTAIRKVGLAPVQRDGLEYEFDIVADLNMDNDLIVSKSRCEAMTGQIVPKAGAEVAETLKAWLTDGAEPVPPVKAPASKPQAQATPKAAPAPAKPAEPLIKYDSPHGQIDITMTVYKALHPESEMDHTLVDEYAEHAITLQAAADLKALRAAWQAIYNQHATIKQVVYEALEAEKDRLKEVMPD